MKTILRLVILLSFAAVGADAQNWTTVSASNITDLNQKKLAVGQLCFLVTDQNDNPISVGIGGGGQTLKRGYCSPVVNGAATSFTVPNPVNTLPSGIYYRVTVTDTSSGQQVLRYAAVTFSGGLFSFDSYQPVIPGATLNTLAGNSVTGNLSVSGNGSITGNATAAGYSTTGNDTAAAFNTSTRGDRQIILQDPDFEGSSILPPPGWICNGDPQCTATTLAYETVTPAPNKKQSLKVISTFGNGGIVQATLFSVFPGDTYSITGMVKGDGSSQAQIFLCWNNKSLVNTSCATAISSSTSWTQLTASGTVPSTDVSVSVGCINSSATQPSTIWCDQISVQKMNFPAGVANVGPHTQIFTSSGTFTIPNGVTQVKVTVVGGGGAGGGSTSTNNGGGGGAGACAIKWLTGLTPANTLAVTIGAGGTGNSGSPGGNGGSSSVVSGTQSITTINAPGGGGGFDEGAVGTGGGGGGNAGTGSVTGGDLNLVGNGGTSGYTISGGKGGSAGGASILGGGAQPSGVAGGGNAGAAPGAGGSGALAGATGAGGNGAAGTVIFEWIS